MTSQDIENIKLGNLRAQRALYDSYADQLMFVIRRYISVVPDQEEILHDVFLKIFSNISKFDSSKAAFETWINRICVNTAINFLKKKKLITSELNDIEKVKTVVNQAISNMNVDHLNLVIESLEEKYKVVFKLRAIEEYEYDEIAKLLNLKDNHVRKLFSRSKSKLQQLLKLNVNTVINTNY